MLLLACNNKPHDNRLWLSWGLFVPKTRGAICTENPYGDTVEYNLRKFSKTVCANPSMHVCIRSSRHRSPRLHLCQSMGPGKARATDCKILDREKIKPSRRMHDIFNSCFFNASNRPARFALRGIGCSNFPARRKRFGSGV